MNNLQIINLSNKNLLNRLLIHVIMNKKVYKYMKYNSYMETKTCNKNTYHGFFQSLASPLKSQIISELREKSMSVSELSHEIGIEQSKLSHALGSLRFCNLVNVHEEGRKRIYSLNKETLLPILKVIEQHKNKYCKSKIK